MAPTDLPPPYRTTPQGKIAGRLLGDLRRDKGLSPEALSYAILAAGLGSVSGKTIRRTEKGMVPTARVQYAVATFFERGVSQIWTAPPEQRAA